MNSYFSIMPWKRPTIATSRIKKLWQCLGRSRGDLAIDQAKGNCQFSEVHERVADTLKISFSRATVYSLTIG